MKQSSFKTPEKVREQHRRAMKRIRQRERDAKHRRGDQVRFPQVPMLRSEIDQFIVEFNRLPDWFVERSLKVLRGETSEPIPISDRELDGFATAIVLRWWRSQSRK